MFGVAVLAAIFAANGSYRTGQAFVDGMLPALRIGAVVVAVGAVVALAIGSRARSTAEVASDRPSRSSTPPWRNPSPLFHSSPVGVAPAGLVRARSASRARTRCVNVRDRLSRRNPPRRANRNSVCGPPRPTRT